MPKVDDDFDAHLDAVLLLRTPAGDVHVHVWQADGEDERRHLVFRDRLRSNESDRAEYERAKRELVGHWRDMNYYARAKGTVIERILARADNHAVGPTRDT